MFNQLYLSDSFIHGIGVFTAVDIPKGAPILKLDDSRVVTAHDPLRPEEGEFDYHCDY